MMIKFKDAQGDIVTPKSGDYVMASDMQTEEQHNAVREELSKYFGDKGYGKYGEEDDVFNVIMVGGGFGVEWAHETNHLCKRRLTPIYQSQTLFEAAKDAPDGTRFKVGGSVYEKTGECLFYIDAQGRANGHCTLITMNRTDFEIIPSGPVKRDCDTTVLNLVGTLCIEVPDDMLDDFVSASDLMARLLMWPGAQIGKPGWSASFYNDQLILTFYSRVSPEKVSFEKKEQGIAAWKHECPELFK